MNQLKNAIEALTTARQILRAAGVADAPTAVEMIRSLIRERENAIEQRDAAREESRALRARIERAQAALEEEAA